MKKFLFDVLLSFIGLVLVSFFLVYAALNPWDYDGITGIIGALLGTDTLFAFIISIAFMVTGISICGYEAYKKK